MVMNQSGQVAVEYILIAVITVIIATTIINRVRKGAFIPQLVDGPSEQLRGMTESGVWKNSRDAKAEHPGLLVRKVSVQARREVN